jgi:hypothetical protein
MSCDTKYNPTRKCPVSDKSVCHKDFAGLPANGEAPVITFAGAARCQCAASQYELGRRLFETKRSRERPWMSRAASVSQQMSGAVGVAVAAISIQLVQFGFGDATLMTRDLSLAFVMVAVISSLSVLVFFRLAPDAGAAVSGKLVPTSEEGAPAAAE